MHIKCPDSSTKILSSAIQKMARNTPAWMWTMANASPKPITLSIIKISENVETEHLSAPVSNEVQRKYSVLFVHECFFL